MQRIPPVVPASDLKQNQHTVLAMVEAGPVIIAQRGRAAAVLVALETWNEIAAELEQCRQSKK
jgi:prevent-host-death family protein